VFNRTAFANFLGQPVGHSIYRGNGLLVANKHSKKTGKPGQGHGLSTKVEELASEQKVYKKGEGGCEYATKKGEANERVSRKKL